MRLIYFSSDIATSNSITGEIWDPSGFGCKPGMLIEAQKKYDINMELSWMIGDSERDITAANLAGVNNTILVRSGHKIDEDNSQAKFILNSVLNVKQIISE